MSDIRLNYMGLRSRAVSLARQKEELKKADDKLKEAINYKNKVESGIATSETELLEQAELQGSTLNIPFNPNDQATTNNYICRVTTGPTGTATFERLLGF